MNRSEIESLLAQFEECKVEPQMDAGKLYWFACEFEKIIRAEVSTSRITKTRAEAEAFVEAMPLPARYAESSLYKLLDFIYEGAETTWDEWAEE